METVKTISSQTLWQLLAKAGSSLATLYLLSLVAHRYSPDQFGLYTLALTYLSFFYLLADLGINAHILPSLNLGDFARQWRRLLGFRLFLGIWLIFLSLALLPWLPFANRQFVVIIQLGIISIIPSAAFVTSNALFQSRLTYQYSSLASLLNSFVSTLVIVYLIHIQSSITLLSLGSVAGWLVCAGVSLWLVSKSVKDLLPILDIKFITGLFVATWPIALTLVVNTVYFRADAFILASVKGLTEAGIYNLAYSIFQAALVLPTFIMNGYYPLMIKSFAENKLRLKQQLRLACWAMAGLGALGLVATLLLAPSLIHLIGGTKFKGSTFSLQLLSFGFPAFFMTSLLMWLLVLLKKYRTMLGIYALGLTLNIVLNLAFIPHYSYLASSVITGFSEYLILSLQLTILYKYL